MLDRCGCCGRRQVESHGSLWRSNIFEALVRCKALAAEAEAEASEAARHAFIEKRLLPQANALQDDGWCVLAARRDTTETSFRHLLDCSAQLTAFISRMSLLLMSHVEV